MLSIGYTFKNSPEENYVGEIVEECERLGLEVVTVFSLPQTRPNICNSNK